MRLNKEQQELVVKNLRLVHYLVKRMHAPPEDEDDWISIGYFGLIKAAIAFDATKGTQFSSYAGKCIQNEILMELRKSRYKTSILSLEAPIATDDSTGNELTLSETIVDPDEDFREEIANTYEFESLLNIILNLFKPGDAAILLYEIAGMSQTSIGKAFNFSQSWIARVISKTKQKLKAYLNNPHDLKKFFRMEIVDDFYRISYSLKDSTNFSKISTSLPDRLVSFTNLPNYNVVQNNKQVTIELPALQESFYIIAEFIQVVHNYEPIFHNYEPVVKIKKAEEIVEKSNNVKYDEIKCGRIISVDRGKFSKKDEKEEKNSSVTGAIPFREIRKYILSLEGIFTVQEVNIHFPDVSYSTIYSAIKEEIKYGHIISVDRGKFSKKIPEP